MNEYNWVYFLDDSWEEWMIEMPTSGMINMPKNNDDLDWTRKFLILNELAEITSEYNCVVTQIESDAHFQELLNEEG